MEWPTTRTSSRSRRQVGSRKSLKLISKMACGLVSVPRRRAGRYGACQKIIDRVTEGVTKDAVIAHDKRIWNSIDLHRRIHELSLIAQNSGRELQQRAELS